MATDIVSALSDQRIRIDNSQAGRLLLIPNTSWTEMWFAGRWSMEDTGANIVATSRLSIGLLSSPSAAMANGPLGTTTSHWVGVRNIDNAWTRTTSPVIHYSCPGFRAFKKIVNTFTQDGAASPNQSALIPVTSTNIRTAWVLRILKTQPNFTIQVVNVTGTNGLVDISFDAIKDALLLDSITNLTTALNAAIGGSGTRYTASAIATNLPVDEGTNGTLNAICFALGRDIYVDFSDVCFVRKS